jgi:signal transduction histidine kinase/ActR/RegA family two-component response regulator
VAEDLRKGVRKASSDSGTILAERNSRRVRSRPPINFTVETHNTDLPQTDSSTAAELTASDFRHLIHISSAEIGCFSFSNPIPCDISPEEFARSLYDIESRCLEGNHRLAARAGYHAPERMLHSSLSNILPPDLGYREMFEEWHKRSLTGQGFDVQTIDRSGRPMTYHAAIYGRIDDEKLSRIWVILRDISAFARAIKALGKTENHYRTLVNTSDIILLRVLLDGTVDYASDYARAALGIPAFGVSHIDTALKPVVHHEDADTYEALASERSRGIVPPTNSSLRLRISKGEYQNFSVRQLAHISSTGDLDYYDLLAFRDVSASNTEITRSLQGATENAAVIHDVNNQLLVIRSQLELALDSHDRTSTSLRHNLSQALDACALASSMTLQALGRTTSIGSGQESVNISSFLQSVVGQLRNLVPLRISLIVESCPPHLTVHAHRPHLYQIVTNLVLNARDAISDTGAIRLAATEVGGTVVITVTDNGCGMTPEVLANAFTPYASTKKRDSGTGLGLYNVRRLARQNHGEVTISSEANRGTVMSFMLPSIGPRKGPLEAPSQNLSTGKPFTLFIADDESAVRDTLLSALSRRGYRVFATPDGASLIAELRRCDHACDLVIVDDGMPLMSSSELMRELREISHQLPILLTSGDPSRAHVLRGVSGPCVFVGKPFGLHDLYGHVERLLTSHEKLSV